MKIFLDENKENLPPFVCTFQGKVPTDKIDLEMQTDDSKIISIKGHTNHVTLTSNQNDAENLQCKYAIGYVDGDKLILRPASFVSMSVEAKAINRHDPFKTTVLANSEAKNALGEAFGTKRKQRDIRAFERSKIHVESIKESTDIISAEIDDNSYLLKSADELKELLDQSRPIPKFDATATDVSSVYSLESILEPSERQSLSADKIDNNDLISFVFTRLSNAVSSNDRSRIEKLLYLSYLAKFYALKRISVDKLKSFPKLISKHMLSTFASHTNGKFSCSKEQKIKLLCYIAVMALMVNNYTVEVDSLARELQIIPSKLADCFKAVGCKIKAATFDSEKVRTAHLTIPLDFPKPKRGRNK